MDTVFNPFTGNLDLVSSTVQSVVLKKQPVTGGVVDHGAVQWINGASKWSPAIAVWSNSEYFEPLGFAVNVSGGFADIYVAGVLDGFTPFGAFAGYDVYVDPAIPGAITFLPVPFTDTYVVMGKAISQTAIKIQPYNAADYITSKGGLLTNAGANNGTGDQVLAVGGDGNVLTARSASTLGLAWQPAVVAAAPFTYTTATRTLTIATATDSVAGVLSAADHTTYTGYAASIALKANLASPTFTGTPSLPTGTIGVTQIAGNSTTALATTAFVTTANNLKANLASPTFTGTPTLPTGTIGVTQIAGNSTTALATTAFVTTADNLKAPLASPTFTGGVIISTTTGALTLPKLTTAQETALTAVEGMLIYNTTLHKMRIRTVSAWETVTSV